MVLSETKQNSLNSRQGNILIGAIKLGGTGGGAVGRGVRGDLGQAVLLALRAAAGAELARRAGRVAAGQEATDAHAPQEPPGGPAAPTQHHAARRHPQQDVENQQWRRRRNICGCREQHTNIFR